MTTSATTPDDDLDEREQATSSATASTPEEDEDDALEELTPDEVLYFKLAPAFDNFMDRQREILRLSLYIKERSDDIDDAKAQARVMIERQLTDVDDDALEAVWDTYVPIIAMQMSENRLSRTEIREAIETAVRELTEVVPAGSLSSYINGVARASLAPPAVPMLLSSLLVSLVGELESLIASVARALFERNPRTLEDSGRSFTWSEIASFGDLDEFKEHVIERSIESMLRGSLNEWLTYLESKFGVAKQKIASEFLATEMVQRRHVIVHAGGRASRQYLEHLQGHKHSVQLGDNLTVDHDYLARAADVMSVLALGIVSAAGFKLSSEDKPLEWYERDIANTCYFLLQEKRYGCVKLITSHVSIDRMKVETYQQITRVNRWIALKKLGEFEDVRSRVEAWDVASRSNDLKLAKFALLDEVEDGFELAQRMLETDELPLAHWLQWPLLEDIRDFGAPDRVTGIEYPSDGPLDSDDLEAERHDEHS